MSDSVVLGTGKVFSELFALSDAAALALAKGFSDSLGISDSILITPGLLLTDAMNIGDAIVLEFGLNPADSVGISESISFDFGMNLADAFGIADTFIVGTALYFSDAFSIADTISMIRQMGIQFADTFSVGDSIALMLSKSLSEAMGLGDNVAFAVGKGLSDSLGVSDAKVVSIGKGLTDILSITDALYKALTVGEQIAGLKRIAEVLANAPNETQAWMPYVGIGSSDIEGDEEAETSLWTELHRKLGAVTVRANTYFIRATFGQDEPTGDDLTIKEVGIFDAATGGKLGKRWVLENDESKDNIDEIVVECAVTILHGTRSAFDIGMTLPFGEAWTGAGTSSPRGPGEVVGITDVISLSLGGQLTLPDDGSGVENLGVSDSMLFSNIGKNLSDSVTIGDSISVVLAPGNGEPGPGAPAPGYNDILVDGDYMYCACGHPEGDGILIYDVTSEANPTRVGWVTLSDRQPLRLDKVEGILYATSYNGLYTINVSNPALPVELDFIELCVAYAPAPRVSVYDTRAYVICPDAGLQIVNISDPSNLVEIIGHDFDVADAGDYLLPDWNEAILSCRIDPGDGFFPAHDYFYGVYQCPGGGVSYANQATFRFRGGWAVKANSSGIYINNTAVIWRLTLSDDPVVDWIWSVLLTPITSNSASFDLLGTQIFAHQYANNPNNENFQMPTDNEQTLVGSCALTGGNSDATAFGKTVYEPVNQIAYICTASGFSIVDTTIPAEIATIPLVWGSRGADATATNIYLGVWNVPGGHRVNIYNIAAPNSPALPALVGVAN